MPKEKQKYHRLTLIVPACVGSKKALKDAVSKIKSRPGGWPRNTILKTEDFEITEMRVAGEAAKG